MSWVRCSERQPADNEMVLFVARRKKHYGDFGHERPSVECGSRYVIGSNGSWSVAYDAYYGDSWPDRDVTHWQPMPDPPLVAELDEAQQ